LEVSMNTFIAVVSVRSKKNWNVINICIYSLLIHSSAREAVATFWNFERVQFLFYEVKYETCTFQRKLLLNKIRLRCEHCYMYIYTMLIAKHESKYLDMRERSNVHVYAVDPTISIDLLRSHAPFNTGNAFLEEEH
jgi:hypothetical protein